mmetsp:Transcript_3109/g.6733  ORF Transcript_3109/g.6733 Transcript_3109/m.6733 type:complete len:127 (+) Transcript_3109:67-447(+)
MESVLFTSMKKVDVLEQGEIEKKQSKSNGRRAGVKNSRRTCASRTVSICDTQLRRTCRESTVSHRQEVAMAVSVARHGAGPAALLSAVALRNPQTFACAIMPVLVGAIALHIGFKQVQQLKLTLQE